MKVSVNCRTCEHHEELGCKIGWCKDYVKYECIIPRVRIKRMGNYNKYYLTDEFIEKEEFVI